MEKVKNTQLKGSNRCFTKRDKPMRLSGGKDDRYEGYVFQKRVIKNWFASKALRANVDEILDAICLLQAGELREDVPKDLLFAYDSVKSILRCDGTFDLRAGMFDATKAYVTVLLACRPKYVEKMVKRNYETKFFYDTRKSAEVNGNAVAARILRYLEEETRDLIIPDEVTLDLFGQEVEIRPDLLAVDHHKKTVEAIKIRVGKSDCSARGKSRDHNLLNNLELYSLYAYARHIAKTYGWDEEKCAGSYYFLRKEADRSTEGYLEPGYFASKNTKHLAILKGNPIKIDDVYKPQFEEYIIGEECSGEDCEKCERYELCHFAEAPLKTEVERKEKSLDDISLSPAQEEVVNHRKGIMCVNAGAGSGKTTVSALRIAFMIAEALSRGETPEEALGSILAVTFTDAAAGEVRDRVGSYLKGLGIEIDLEGLNSVTFNKFGQTILNTEYATVGFTAPPRPIDATERAAIVADLLDRKPVTGLYYPDINLKLARTRFKGARLIAEEAFDAIKSERLSAYDVDKLRDALSESSSAISSPEAYQELMALYDDFDEELRSRNLVEFQDQESIGFFEVLDNDPYYFDRMGFKHIIIDEFQDTSKNQMEVLYELLSVSSFESCLVVGDDSQGIYGWRKADVTNIVDFAQKIQDRLGMPVKVVNLVENYRSTPEIIEFANGINALNTYRVEKDLVATRPSGKPVVVKGFHKVDKEYEYIVSVVEEKIAEGHAPEEIAILTYTKAEVGKIAGKLTEAGIESSLQAPQKMLENSRVKGICSLARACEDITATLDIANFMNCIDGGKFKEMTLEESEELIDEGRDIVLKIRYSAEPQKSRAFRNVVDEIAGEDDFAINLAERLDRFATVDQMIDYIKSFIRFDGETLKREGLYSGVVLSTAHSSKGLEWPIIINSITKYDNEMMGAGDREEHRRLLFVSSTRARDELYITGQVRLSGTVETGYAVNRFMDEAATVAGQPLDLLDEDGVKEREAKREARKAKIAEEKERKTK